MFLLLSIIICIWNESSYRQMWNGQRYVRKAYWSQAILFFGVVIFFCGLRSGVADTGTYIAMFEDFPTNISQVNWNDISKDKGFYLFSVIFKQFISTDFHGWLFLCALVSGIALMKGLVRYSEYFGLSCFLFIANTMFTYFLNGMRQFIAVTIFFYAAHFIFERKWKEYVLTILFISTIHGSAIILLFVYFLGNMKPWGRSMRTVIFVSVAAGLFFDRLFPVVGNLLMETQYKGYVDYISSQGAGSSVIRLLIAAVPCILAYLGRKVVQEQGNQCIDFCVNMSIINFCLYVIATFSSGMVVGRLTTYFDIFNLVLLPWLIYHVFTEESRKIIVIACMAFYIVFFYFQMVMVWGIGYESDILRMIY